MNTEQTTKTAVHFTDNYLLNPTNPISVNLIGAGGTGSKVLTALMEINESLIALGHAGLQVRLWDDDVITTANLGRQRFLNVKQDCTNPLHSSTALIVVLVQIGKPKLKSLKRISLAEHPKSKGNDLHYLCGQCTGTLWRC